MKLRALNLSVKRSEFRMNDDRKNVGTADKEFRRVTKSVLTRDKNQCQFCGFIANKWQECHHIDDDHSNNDPKNLVTTCKLCHMCHHIGFAGMKNMGVMIYLPAKYRVTQAELNSMVRQLWLISRCAPAKSREVVMAKGLISFFYRQRKEAERIFQTSSPVDYANTLLRLSEDAYKKRMTLFEGVYMLPLATGYSSQVEYWMEKFKRDGLKNFENWERDTLDFYMSSFKGQKESYQDRPAISRLKKRICE